MSSTADVAAAAADPLDGLDDFARSPQALAELSDKVTDVVRPRTGATAVCITVWDEERDILRALPGAFGATDHALLASITGPSSNTNSVAARVFTTGRSHMINRADGDPGVLQDYVAMFQIDRVMTVPLRDGNRPVGALILVNKPEDFTLHDLEAAEAVAPRIARAVELARWHGRLRVQQRLENVLATTAVAIASGRTVRECLLPAFQTLGAVSGAALVGLYPAEGAPLVWRQGIVGSALERRFAADAAELVHQSAGAYPHAAGDPGWAALHTPVELYGTRTAALSILRRTGEPFSRDEAQAVSRLANVAALAWATEGYQHQLAALARSAERERIADELHDRVAQILFAAQLGLDSMLEGPEDAPVDRERVAEVRGLLTKGDTAIREVIRRLEAAPGTSLQRRLRLAVEAVEDEFGLSVRLDLPEQDLEPGDKLVSECLVKVAREAIVNAAKHAGPCRVSLRLEVTPHGKVVLAVVDDGLGGTVDGTFRAGHGIRSLRRAVRDAGGSLRITPSHKFGTRVTASFPL